jgi:hypothetical protein
MNEQGQNKKNQEKFRRRKISLLNKADDIYRLCRADVFFAIRKWRRYYAYISTQSLGWLPTKEQIVSHLLLYETVVNKPSGKELPSPRNKETSGF